MIAKLMTLACLLLFLTACQTGKPDTAKTDDGFPDFSEEELQEMISKSPQAQMELNKAQQQSGQSSMDMIQKIEGLIEKEPDNVGHHYMVGKLYHQEYMQDSVVDNANKGIEHYTAVLQLDPQHEEGKAYYNRMLLYLATNQLDEAMSDVNAFVKTNNKKTPVNYWTMMAEIDYRRGNQKQACLYFDKALQLFQTDSLPVENEAKWKERCGIK